MAKHQKLTVGELRERLDRFSDKATIAVILGLTAGKVTAASLVVEIGGADHLLYQFQRISDHSGAIQFIGSGVKKTKENKNNDK